MTIQEKIAAINARSRELRKGYATPNGTAYCDSLPTIRCMHVKSWLVECPRGEGDTQKYKTPEEAVEGAIDWFFDCVHGAESDAMVNEPEENIEYTSRDLIEAVALGDTGKAWSTFRGF